MLDPGAPGGGLRFEVQLHTLDSLSAKELEHHWYEIKRSPNSTPEEAAAAQAQSDLLFGDVPFPDGAEAINLEYLQKL